MSREGRELEDVLSAHPTPWVVGKKSCEQGEDHCSDSITIFDANGESVIPLGEYGQGVFYEGDKDLAELIRIAVNSLAAMGRK